MSTFRKTGANTTKPAHWAVVSTIRSIQHLDPRSWRHALDKLYAAELRTRLGQVQALDMSPSDHLCLPSLGQGFILDGHANGEIEEGAFEQMLSALRSSRATYIYEQREPDGSFRQRVRKTKPITQFVVTVFPAHGLFFDFLEREGQETKTLIKDCAARMLGEIRRNLPHEILAVAVHPEESVLHYHFILCSVSNDHRLLLAPTGPGRPGLGLLSMGLIGTKRLTDFGIWPQEDAAGVHDELRKREAAAKPKSLNLVLSEILDGLIEKFVADHRGDPIVQRAYSRAMESYAAFAIERRAHRPDVLEKTVDALTAELERVKRALDTAEKQANFWREKFEQAQISAPPVAPETLSPEVVQAALFRLTAAVGKGEAPPPDAAKFFTVIAGKFDLSKESEARLKAREALLQSKAQQTKAAAAALEIFRVEMRQLQSALNNARRLLEPTPSAPGVTMLQRKKR